LVLTVHPALPAPNSHQSASLWGRAGRLGAHSAPCLRPTPTKAQAFGGGRAALVLSVHPACLRPVPGGVRPRSVVYTGCSRPAPQVAVIGTVLAGVTFIAWSVKSMVDVLIEAELQVGAGGGGSRGGGSNPRCSALRQKAGAAVSRRGSRLLPCPSSRRYPPPMPVARRTRKRSASPCCASRGGACACGPSGRTCPRTCSTDC